MSSGLSAGRPSSRTGRPATTLNELARTEKPARVNFETTQEQHRRIKTRAAEQGKTVKEYLIGLIERDLDSSS